MNILLFTVFLSVLLVFLFIVLFVNDRKRSKNSSLERDSLLPLAEESSIPAKKPSPHSTRDPGK